MFCPCFPGILNKLCTKKPLWTGFKHILHNRRDYQITFVPNIHILITYPPGRPTFAVKKEANFPSFQILKLEEWEICPPIIPKIVSLMSRQGFPLISCTILPQLTLKFNDIKDCRTLCHLPHFTRFDGNVMKMWKFKGESATIEIDILLLFSSF